MDDLVAFIEARLAEDEATARSVKPLGHTDALGGIRIEHEFAVTRLVASGEDGSYRSEADKAAAAHFRRHDPARALRELPLKRRLLDEHRPRSIVDPNGDERDDWPERVCGICDQRWMGTPDWEQGDDFVPPEPEYCGYLRTLGSIWSEHPSFRPEWLTEEDDHA